MSQNRNACYDKINICVMLNISHAINHIKITSIELQHINVGHPEQIHKMLLDFVALS